MAEKNIKNTHPKNLGILQFWILHFDFSTLLQAYYPAYPALLAACALVSYPLCSYALVPCALLPFVPLCLGGHQSIMQNKANVKMGNINISTAKIKAYANKQRTMNNERYSKQTQSNPIPPTQYAIRNTQYEEQTQTKPILPPRSAIRPTWRRAVIRCIMVCEKQCQSALIRVKKQNRSV
jgi:hypothetical protein